MEYKKGS